MINKLVSFSAALLVFSALAFGQTKTAAANPAAVPPPVPSDTAATTAPSAVPLTKIGIINMQQAILASNEGRREFEVLTKKFEPKQTELKGTNEEVEGLKRQLNTQGDKLNESARANLVKTIDQKQKSLQRSLEDAQSDFQAQQNEIVNRIGGKMMDVLDKYAKTNAYALILDVSSQTSPVLWAGASTDVTKAIVDQYNTVSGVPAPASAPSATRNPLARPAGGARTTPKPATPPPPKQ